jgi:hypothetical protein
MVYLEATAMSKRFLRWIDNWIEDHVRPGAGGDFEAFDVRAGRLAGELLTEAREQGFGQEEIDEEAGKVAPMIETRLSTKPEFDLSQFGVPGDD